MFEFLRSLFWSFISMVSNQKGTDVVEVTDTSTSDLDYAIPEQINQCSLYGNIQKKTFSEYHGKPERAIRGKV